MTDLLARKSPFVEYSCTALAGLAIGWLAGLTNAALAPNLLATLLAVSALVIGIPILPKSRDPVPSPPTLAVICMAVAAGFTAARWCGGTLRLVS